MSIIDDRTILAKALAKRAKGEDGRQVDLSVSYTPGAEQGVVLRLKGVDSAGFLMVIVDGVEFLLNPEAIVTWAVLADLPDYARP